jgi:rhodanese-related sulfurtransferase
MLNFLKKLLVAGPNIRALLDDGAVLIDVRSAAEYKAGHVKKSINIPLDQIGQNMEKIRGMNVPVVTCCKSGVRSGIAASKLKSQGLEAYNGGGWKTVDRALS